MRALQQMIKYDTRRHLYTLGAQICFKVASYTHVFRSLANNLLDVMWCDVASLPRCFKDCLSKLEIETIDDEW